MNYDENEQSPAHVDFSKTKSNLMQKFEQSAAGEEQQHRKSFNRYDEMAQDEEDLNAREGGNHDKSSS